MPGLIIWAIGPMAPAVRVAARHGVTPAKCVVVPPGGSWRRRQGRGLRGPSVAHRCLCTCRPWICQAEAGGAGRHVTAARRWAGSVFGESRGRCRTQQAPPGPGVIPPGPRAQLSLRRSPPWKLQRSACRACQTPGWLSHKMEQAADVAIPAVQQAWDGQRLGDTPLRPSPDPALG